MTRFKNRRNGKQWRGGMPLEPRVMLAGDMAASVVAVSTNADVSNGDVNGVATNTGGKAIVFVDSSIEDTDAVIDAVTAGHDVVLIDQNSSGIEQVSRVLANRRECASIHFITHGSSGQIQLGNELIDAEMLKNRSGVFRQWGKSLTQTGDILLYGCEVGQGQRGVNFIDALAKLTGADVTASSNVTGSLPMFDWVLERSVGTIDADSALDLTALAKYAHTLPITIRAAGQTGEEQMQLQIDGVIVQTWDNIGGDYSNREFQTFTYENASPVNASSVRVLFSNDVFIEGVKDRNLRVDNITIDGRVFETEDASVFGTGTWKEPGGITPGFRESEYIHSNGYFQYFEAAGNGSEIAIFAAGQTNEEAMELWIAGTKVQTWQDIGGNGVNNEFVRYSFIADSSVTADQVQIRFANDRFVDGEPPFDRNLRVDYITIDGVIYETEAPTTFSTATWRDGFGVTPGFTQSEWLHSNGYFQYDQTPVNAGSFRLASSVITVDEIASTASITILRTGGSDGISSIDYQTNNGTAIAGIDYTGVSGTFVFADGETSKTVVINILDDTLVEGDESFSFTIDRVVGAAGLLAPRTATITIVDDEVAEPSLPVFPNFESVNGLTFNGDASQSANELRLTTANTFSGGSVYFNSPMVMGADDSFSTQFSFALTGGNGLTGADGFTFVLQNSPQGVDALGVVGSGLGYETISRSVAIEFDTYRNAFDVNDNHIAVNVNGNVQQSLYTTTAPIDLNSGAVRYAWVDYNGTTNRLRVFVSSTSTRPTTPTISASLDLPTILGGSAYVGFTGSTGGQANTHRLLSWQLDRSVPGGSNSGTSAVAAVDLVTGLQVPTAVQWSPDGRNMYIAQQNGVVALVRDDVKSATAFIDISAQVNGTRDRGLLDIALHPDFETNPYVYLLFTYDPPEVYQNASNTLAGPDRNGNRAGRLVRVTADAATGYTTVIAGSEVVLLGKNSTWQNFNAFANSTNNFSEPAAGVLPDGSYLEDFIPSDSESHTVGALAFGIDGTLFVSIGDGASYNQTDPRAVRTLDIDSLSGKVLRIDPITGQGLTDNPFYNGDPDANRSKVYQYGLRNPFRITVDPTNGQLFVGDVGWTRWEEINSAGAGANFGWPYFEGGSGVTNNLSSYQNLASYQEYLTRNESETAALYALNHAQSGINAIVVGDVYYGGAYGDAMQGNLLFNDLGQGIVRRLSLNPDGTVASVDVFATGANIVVDIAQGPDGLLYYVDLDNGKVGRWEVV